MSAFPDVSARDPEGLARIFRHYGEIEAPRLDSRVYTSISLGMADDPELLELAAQVSVDQPPPNVLYAAVQDLLLRGDDESREAVALSSFFPAVSGRRIESGTAWPAFRAYCRKNASRLAPILSTSKTQTCVVHRCAAILPALAVLPRVAEWAGRVALLEIGPSAGLSLRLDCYRYDYGGGATWGAVSAEPVLEVETRGTAKPPLPERIEVVARLGIDLNRLDVADPAVVRWLRALVWPEHVERVRAMDAALAHADRVPIEIVEGDATREIEAMIERMPSDAARVLFATQVLYQISQGGRDALLQGIARASRDQPLDLVLLESSGEGDSRLEWLAFEGGGLLERRSLARVDSHGRWIEWGAD